MKITLYPVLVTPKGTKKPVRAEYNVYAAFKQVQDWYLEQLGTTFNLSGVVALTLPETWEQITTRRSPAKINGFNIWLDAMNEGMKQGKIKLSPTKAYYLVYLRPPTPEQWLDGFGGMAGVEHWMSYDRPGMACIADEKTWLIAGLSNAQVEAMGYDSWVKTVGACIGALAHEIVHIVSDLPHGVAPSVTFSWWAGPCGANLADFEKEAIKATGLLG